MGKIEHSCCGGYGPNGKTYPCLCGTCKRDTVDCCFAHRLPCPEFMVQDCPDFEPEEDEEDELDLQ